MLVYALIFFQLCIWLASSITAVYTSGSFNLYFKNLKKGNLMTEETPLLTLAKPSQML